MTTRTGLFGAWCAQAWRCVLETTQAMAGLDLTGQFTGCGPPLDPVVPVEWVHQAMVAAPDAWWTPDCATWVQVAQEATTQVAPWAATYRPPALTSTEQVCLLAMRERYQANRTCLTAHELAHLQFVRWLYHTGRITA